MNCGDCILLRVALRNRRSRLLFANYIRAFRAFPRSKTSPPYMHTARRKKRSFTGNSALNLNHFSVMFFRKTRKISDGVLSVLRAKFDAVFGNLSPETSAHFSVMFFRKTRKISDGVLSVLRAKFDAVFGKLSPNLKSFSVMFFRKTRLLSRRCICIPQGARNAVLQETQPETSAHFSVMFFSQDKENKRRRTSVLQAKFDAVLRKNSPKNQISIMSASFFFAISSISLTYLSVIF